MRVKVGLPRHIVWEEGLLFPLWEKKTGRSEEGPSVVMRVEHRQIEQQLEAIHSKVMEQNPDSDKEVQGLLDLLGSHNIKEERALYPAIDQVASAEERETVFQNMKNIPEERYKLCCG
jgi:regulator of cell morphogenesis and NO signaling